MQIQTLVNYLDFVMARKKPMRLKRVENYITKGYMPPLSFQFYLGPGEVQVVTEIEGDKETVNVARHGDVIVCGVKGEMYVVSGKKFGELYDVTEEDGSGDVVAVARPQPRCVARVTEEAMRAVGTETLVFTAPWGEDMVLRAGDVLVREGEGSACGYYRVESGAFDETYDWFSAQEMREEMV